MENARVRFLEKSRWFVTFCAEHCGGFWLGVENKESFGCDLSDTFEGFQNTTPRGRTVIGTNDRPTTAPALPQSSLNK